MRTEPGADVFYTIMSKKSIQVQGHDISVLITPHSEDYISLTDMVRGAEGEDHIRNWMRNKNTIEFLGIWEQLNNPNFKGVEFDTFLREAGLNRFNMTPRKWIDATNAIGIKSYSGRGGGTYAHKDIAFEFGAWISPAFKLYLIKEYQRLKEAENDTLALDWDLNRMLTKANYHLHTDAIKQFVIPSPNLSKRKQAILYADEADMLNLSVFGYTAKQWEEANPKLKGKYNMRDTASINELIVMSNVESMNAELIKKGIFSQSNRFAILHKMAKEQLRSLNGHNIERQFRRMLSDSKGQEPPKEIE